MINFIIESEQRVGSRWIHYLLANYYGVSPSPEVDGNRLEVEPDKTVELINSYLDSNKIPKFHHVDYRELLKYFPDKKVISIVRNPRDRAVSVAFHHIHDPGKAEWPQRGMTDEDAIRYTVLEYDRYPISNARMLSNMPLGHSTLVKTDANHIWVAYEWLRVDPVNHLSSLTDWLHKGGCKSPVIPLEVAIGHNSFKNKSKRSAGEEDRTDTWRRKGVNNDWINWFNSELVHATEDVYNSYYQKLIDERLLYERKK